MIIYRHFIDVILLFVSDIQKDDNMRSVAEKIGDVANQT